MGLRPGETVKFTMNSKGKVTLEKNNWKSGLASLGREVSAHLKSENVKPLSDEKLDELIDLSASRAIRQKYDKR